MSSYYDDPDFAAEYERRDAEAVDAAITEREERGRPGGSVFGDVWCTSCAHTHIPTIPVVTWRCAGPEGQEGPRQRGCGFGCWHETEAARHLVGQSDHIVYPVVHSVVPLEQRPAEWSGAAGPAVTREALYEALLDSPVFELVTQGHYDSLMAHLVERLGLER